MGILRKPRAPAVITAGLVCAARHHSGDQVESSGIADGKRTFTGAIFSSKDEVARGMKPEKNKKKIPEKPGAAVGGRTGF